MKLIERVVWRGAIVKSSLKCNAVAGLLLGCDFNAGLYFGHWTVSPAQIDAKVSEICPKLLLV
jgi:hypothetical protein